MKKIVVSLLASSLLFGAGVYAGTSLDEIKAYKNPFEISIDGNATDFNNAPLLYNNLTYVPLTELASKLGVDVKWNEKEKKVEINKSLSIPGASGLIVTANEGGSLTFFDVATQKQKELKLAGSVHNVQVAPDGKTVWATVVPGGGHGKEAGHGNEEGHGHANQSAGMNMADHAKMMESTDMGMMDHLKMMMQNGMNMADHDKMMEQMQEQGMPMMDDKVMAEHAEKLGVSIEKMKEVHQKMMTEMMASGNIEHMMKDGMMSDEMLKLCADLLGVPVEKVKALHETMEDHHGTSENGHHEAVNAYSHHNGGGKLVVIDVASMKILKEMTVGAHPAHVVLTPDGKYTLVTDSESNQVSIIDAQAFQKIKDVPVGKMPHGTRISADGKWGYIANMGESTVSVVDIANQKEIKKIEVGKAPVQVGVTKDGKKLVVALNAENAVSVVNLQSGNVQKVKVGVGPAQVYVDPSDQFAYAANQGTEASPSDTVSKVDLTTGKEIYQVKTGAGAHGVTTSMDGKFVFVTNMFDHTLTVLDAETGNVLANQEIGKTPNGITFIQ